MLTGSSLHFALQQKGRGRAGGLVAAALEVLLLSFFLSKMKSMKSSAHPAPVASPPFCICSPYRSPKLQRPKKCMTKSMSLECRQS